MIRGNTRQRHSHRKGHQRLWGEASGKGGKTPRIGRHVGLRLFQMFRKTERGTGRGPVRRNSLIRPDRACPARGGGKGHRAKIAGHIRARAHAGFKIALGHKLAVHISHSTTRKPQLARQNTAGGQPVARAKLACFNGFTQAGGQLTAHAARLERQAAQNRQFGCNALLAHNGPMDFLLMALYCSPICPYCKAVQHMPAPYFR